MERLTWISAAHAEASSLCGAAASAPDASLHRAQAHCKDLPCPVSVLNLLCPPFQGLANAVHFHEPDKTIEVWRIPTKPEALYIAKVFHGKCWALACEVYELLNFFLAEPTDLFRKVTHYIVMIV